MIIGVSLSEPHISVNALSMFACLDQPLSNEQIQVFYEDQ